MFRTTFYAVVLSGLAVLSLSSFAKADERHVTQSCGAPSQATFFVTRAQT
ncbi:hypothetical protein [Pelagimonas varians]|uniref:Uncharacterized protein n=1 Tax=Pelagimonas varians TaxID=696760 RepID=A0A238L0Y6_9RHOB|nr:hypothetical protein [Pelagimonas varians]PYG27192.1 hypothetical protein C8N36_11738 [Pelagimonas varians]SMX48754.1 hypothetical protein PEV8663_03943 [Pelagimonas varians]